MPDSPAQFIRKGVDPLVKEPLLIDWFCQFGDAWQLRSTSRLRQQNSAVLHDHMASFSLGAPNNFVPVEDEIVWGPSTKAEEFRFSLLQGRLTPGGDGNPLILQALGEGPVNNLVEFVAQGGVKLTPRYCQAVGPFAIVDQRPTAATPPNHRAFATCDVCLSV
jgi:hypothetical protein